MAHKAVVITVSDSAHRGKRADASGPALVGRLRELGYELAKIEVVPDECPAIENAIRRASADANLIVTTGGTGLGPRDVTPEATLAVCDRLVPGLPELMRSYGAQHTENSWLSRGVCGICGAALVLNLPGSPIAALESLAAIERVLPHALELLQGKTEH
jgi:molybdopterin adenylyltransferase